ncbi:probable serine/threonine-protein kinase At1g54610 [Asparagus officinalis]|uniref:probable serine/threonine-protein kinase At1g54610 n=1 Tax=Asparagus officinalis TaxID=4686 RepID=UPI00098E4CD1|nr:probable serine/threonine-protein kinase At1g54610 [Asparagus officinalis]
MAREIMILQKLDHPNIVKLEGLATSRMQYSLYLVFEFMHSDLATVISRPGGRLTEPQVKCYMQQLLAGLRHCHEKGILHRDIKGSNLLIDKQGVLKIADFGLANHFNPNKKRPLTSRVVTLWYRSPELLLGCTDYGVGVDLWSAGCLLAEMFAGRPIMPGKTEVEQLHRIFKLCGSPPEDFWRRLNLSASFRPPQPYRPLITEAFKDFPSCSLGLLKMLLALDPSCRGSASSALQNEFFGTSPLACDLSGLPVVCKKEDDESNQPHERRKRRSSKLKHQSRTQKETPTNVEQNMMKLEVGDYGRPVKAGARTTYSHELMRSSTGSTTSGMQPQRYSLSTPPALPPVKSPSFREHVVVRPAHSRELGGSSTTGSTSSSPPPIKPSSILEQRTEAHPAATKNVENGPINHRYGMEKRSASTSGFRRFDAKQIPGR